MPEELIRQCIEGNRHAHEKFYNQYASKMKGVCLRYARSTFEAEDILQEGFIKVFANLSKFKMEGSLEGWIRRIMINTAINHYNKDNVFRNNLEYDKLEEAKIMSEVSDSLQVEELLNLLNTLPLGYKVVFNMYAIEGYSHKEIAEMLNISEGTSKSQLHKAKKYIQEALKKNNIIKTENESGTF